MHSLGLIVAGGGSSRRYGERNKLFEPLFGKPVFIVCLERLLPYVGIENAVLVVPSALACDFRRELELHGLGGLRTAPGGADRAASVQAGLEALPPRIDYVAVQDAARPLSGRKLLERCYEAALEHGAAIAAHRVTDTVKVADASGFAIGTPDRSTLWAAETPQVFRRSLLADAYRHCSEHGMAVTDDAQAVQLAGHAVKLVENMYVNIKITHPNDLAVAASAGIYD